MARAPQDYDLPLDLMVRLSEIRAGIQTQAYATSVGVTVRKGLTKLEVAGYTAGSIVLHPATGRASSSRIDGRAIAKVCGSRSLEPGSGAGHLPYMPNRARRTALTASAGPLTSTCAAR
jgi:hypothetical protein